MIGVNLHRADINMKFSAHESPNKAQRRYSDHKADSTLREATCATITLANGSMMWRGSKAAAGMAFFDATISASTVEPLDLTMNEVLAPARVTVRSQFPSHWSTTSAFDTKVYCKSEQLQIYVRSGLTSTLSHLACNWAQVLNTSQHVALGSDPTLASSPSSRWMPSIQTHLGAYLIRNDTQMSVLARQAGTSELIELEPEIVTGYSWRTIHGVGDHRLQFCVSGEFWSQPVSIDKVGTSELALVLGGSRATLWLEVDPRPGRQRRLILRGSHVIENSLPFAIELMFQHHHQPQQAATDESSQSTHALIPHTISAAKPRSASNPGKSFVLPSDGDGVVVHFRLAQAKDTLI